MPTTVAKLVGVLTFLAAGTDICAFRPLTLPFPPPRCHGGWHHAQQVRERRKSALTTSAAGAAGACAKGGRANHLARQAFLGNNARNIAP